jgi:hypothetical protein
MGSLRFRSRFVLGQCIGLVALLLSISNCASKKPSNEAAHIPLSRTQLSQSKVALVEITGAPGFDSTLEHTIEVALLNAIHEHGYFELIDRASVRESQSLYPEPSDYPGLARHVGARYLLAIDLVDATVKEHHGYDSVTEADSVLTAEGHYSKPVKGTRYVKIKAHDGLVKLRLRFFDVKQNAFSFDETCTTNERVVSRDAHFKGKLALLEQLTATAIQDCLNRITE